MKIFEHKSKLAVIAATPVLAVALALAVGVFTQQAVAGAAGTAFAVGGITTYDGHVAFAAHNLSNKVIGHVVQDSLGTSRSGPVDCLAVSGNHATIAWHVTHSDNPAEVDGQLRFFEMCDNGEPNGGVPADGFFDHGEDSSFACGFNSTCGVAFIHGNIVVKGP